MNEQLIMIGLFELFIILFVLAIVIGLTVFWLWMLVSAFMNEGISGGEKVAWIIAILFAHFIGALLYFFIGRPKRLVYETSPPLMQPWKGAKL